MKPSIGKEVSALAKMTVPNSGPGTPRSPARPRAAVSRSISSAASSGGCRRTRKADSPSVPAAKLPNSPRARTCGSRRRD